MRVWNGTNLITSKSDAKQFSSYVAADAVAKQLNITHRHLLTKNDLFFYAAFY